MPGRFTATKIEAWVGAARRAAQVASVILGVDCILNLGEFARERSLLRRDWA